MAQPIYNLMMADFFVSKGPDSYPVMGRPLIVVIGNFDSIHIGHQALFRKALEWKSKLGLSTIVVTFDPHPLAVLRPPHSRLFDLEDQKEQIIKSKMDGVVYCPFSRDFSEMSAENFLNDYLKKHFNPKVVIVGYNFRFGHGRAGTTDMLKSWGESNDCQVDVVDPIQTTEGLDVSTSELRFALSHGEVKKANKILGRPYRLSGFVIHGEKRGQHLGFPTANIHFEGSSPLAFGVYASKAVIVDKDQNQKKTFNSISHLGPLPTFENKIVRLETHIFNFNSNIYGEKIEIEFYDKIRDVQKFPNIDELKKQIKLDCSIAEEILGDL